MGSVEPDRGQRADKEQRARWGGSAPTRGCAPDGGQRTRWGAVNPAGGRAPDGGQSARWGGRVPDGKQYTWTELHPMGSRVRQGAARPDRSAPDGEQYTRWGAVHLDRTGAMHTDRVSCPHQQAQTRRTAACRDTRRRCGWLDSLRCVWGDASVGHRRGSRCVWGRWLPRRAHPRAGWIAVRVGRCGRGPSTWILAQLVRQ